MDWPSLPPLTALRAFAAAAEHENLTRAAQALNVTQAAVSQQIRNLERHLGTRLITRNRRGIALTRTGRFLADGLRKSFADILALTSDISAAETARPVLVSVSPMFASAFLMPRLKDFMRAHPDIQLNLDSTIEAVELTPGGVDMAIRYGTGGWPGLQSEPLLPGCLTVVGARALIGSRTITEPAQILDYPILQEHASVEFDLWMDKVGIPRSAPRNVIRLPGNMLLDGIRRGDGIGATVPSFIIDELRSGALVPLMDDPIPGIGYHIVTLPGLQRPALRSFIRWLKGTITDLEETLFRHHPLTTRPDS